MPGATKQIPKRELKMTRTLIMITFGYIVFTFPIYFTSLNLGDLDIYFGSYYVHLLLHLLLAAGRIKTSKSNPMKIMHLNYKFPVQL